ncbi:type II secretion system protein GspG, partial [Thermodesulfobacteriota bacterium]
EAYEALGKMGSIAIPSLKKELKSRIENNRFRAVWALGEVGEDAITVISEALKDSNEDMRMAALMALEEIGPPALPSLIKVMKGDDEKMSFSAKIKIRDMKFSEENLPILVEAIKDEDPSIRKIAITALSGIGAPAQKVLKEATKDKDLFVRYLAEESLRGALTKRDVAVADIKAFQEGLRQFYEDNEFYPGTETSLYALVEMPPMGRMPLNYREGGYISEVPFDPWGSQYVYMCPGRHGPYDLWSYGADGAGGGSGKFEDIESWRIDGSGSEIPKKVVMPYEEGCYYKNESRYGQLWYESFFKVEPGECVFIEGQPGMRVKYFVEIGSDVMLHSPVEPNDNPRNCKNPKSGRCYRCYGFEHGDTWMKLCVPPDGKGGAVGVKQPKVGGTKIKGPYPMSEETPET